MGGKESRVESHLVQTELASVQLFLARLKNDLEASGFRPNKVVTDGIAKSFTILESAIDSMAHAELNPALRASKVAWIHAFFARAVLDAEMTEQYLGDQNFLELKRASADTDMDWREFVEKELGELEEQVILLREEIKDAQK